MPTFNDITTFLGGQLLGQLVVPEIDLSGQTFVVTGANTGLGLECTKHLWVPILHRAPLGVCG